uniref:Pentatricopeptide repeat-containing protein n=1 Tax=Arabidopsis thaliana TaxID=3702 RepID=Q1PFW7_ARATH|nr:pentatricopeptide repeat-containing protein [Arabidopsis thaliana]
MRQKGMVMNVVTYTSLIKAFLREEHEITPDAISYNSLISGLCRSGRVTEAIKLFEDMKAAYKVWDQMMDKGFTLDRDVSDTLIKASCSMSADA